MFDNITRVLVNIIRDQVVEDTINGKIDAKPFMSDDPPATQKKRVQVSLLFRPLLANLHEHWTFNLQTLLSQYFRMQ